MDGGNDGPLAGDDDAVRAVLERELARLRDAEPCAALGLPADAAREVRRERFLKLTKAYHPNRFARRSPSVFRLANEVFLLIRQAYECADKPLDDRRPSTIRMDRLERSGSERGLAPPTQPKLDVDAALLRKRREMAQSQTLRGSARDMRQLTPPPQPPAAATPAPSPVSFKTPIPGPAPAPTSAAELVEREKRREEEQKDRFRQALADLRTGQLARARDTFKALLAETPNDKRYRAYYLYANGRDHHAAGRMQEARADYQRALAIDPTLEAARHSLGTIDELLGAPDKGGDKGRDKGGLLSRWFKR